MPKEKEGIAPEPVKEGQPTPELSAEEQLTAITSERDRLNTELESARKGLGTAQQTIRQRDASLRRQQELEDEVAGLSDLLKMSIAYNAEEKGRPPEEFEEAKAKRAPDLLKKFDENQAKRKADAQFRVKRAESEQKSKDAETRVLDLGLTAGDEDYRRIYNLVGEALKDPFKWDFVEADLAKLEGKPKEKKPVETEAEIKERIRREILEERGELKPEGAQPSGGASTFTSAQIADREFYEANREEILKAYKEGRIKE